MKYRSISSISSNGKLKQLKSMGFCDNIKSNFIFKRTIDFIKKKKFLEIMKYNKKLKKRLNLTINDYKEFSKLYSSIELELTIDDNKYGYFINIPDKEIDYYHIYLNNSKEEIKRNHLNEDEKINKLKIKIGYQVKSFKGLFSYCYCINSVNFILFNRINIINTSNMFYQCSSLNELNLSNFITDNVKDMSNMFLGCTLLKELNLSNFKTNNVTNMSSMFDRCLSLKKLNLSNFNTDNVTNMSNMFYQCLSLKELNLSSFYTYKVTNMSNMFLGCTLLKKLNISNFNTNKVTNMKNMFNYCSSLTELNITNFNIIDITNLSYVLDGCQEELIKKIKIKIKTF